MLLRLFAFILLVCFVCPATAELELDDNGFPKKDMLKFFEPYTGRWVGKFNNQATDVSPKPIVITGFQEGKFILNKTMFQMRAIGDADGRKTESLFLYGYDPLEQSYCCWHYSQGGMAIKYKVEWAKDGKSYKHLSLREEDLGFKVRTHVQLDAGKAIRWTSKITANDGTLLIDQTGELTPKPGEAVFPQPDVNKDNPLAIFKPYTGQWISKIKGKRTDVVEQPYEGTSKWTGRYTLGGDGFIFGGTATTPDNQPYAYLWINLYDKNDEQLYCWYHSSFYHHAKHKVHWDPKKREMKQSPIGIEKLGLIPDFRTYLVDDQTLRFTFTMKTEDGLLISDESGEAKPVKGDSILQ